MSARACMDGHGRSERARKIVVVVEDVHIRCRVAEISDTTIATVIGACLSQILRCCRLF